MKKILSLVLLFLAVEVSYAIASPGPVKIGPLFRKANGMPLNFDQYDFYGDVCHRDGYRLPTIKELALALNPKGVYEKPVAGLELQTIYTKDGAVDFYYDYRTYIQDPADHGRYLIRTSSVADTYGTNVALFRFSSEGKIKADTLDFTIWNATKCAIPPKPSNPILTDFEKQTDGQLIFFRDYESAEKYCRKKGTRAPTARELAIHAQSLGAQGITEKPVEGSVLIEAIDTDGKEDRFYYSSKGYIQPGGDFGGVVVWSNSQTKIDAPWSTVWGMDSKIGEFRNNNPLTGAVRCLAK